MVESTQERLIGASELDERLFDAFQGHEREEQEVLEAYAAFAEQTGSQTVRYLINIIVEDERRHHRILAELANTIRAEATFEERGRRVPDLDIHRRDQAILDSTRQFLEIERRDRDEFKGLAKQMDRLGAPLNSFLVRMVLDDTDRHIRILRFIERLVRQSPLP
jgi:rubrerythrin